MESSEFFGWVLLASPLTFQTISNIAKGLVGKAKAYRRTHFSTLEETIQDRVKYIGDKFFPELDGATIVVRVYKKENFLARCNVLEYKTQKSVVEIEFNLARIAWSNPYIQHHDGFKQYCDYLIAHELQHGVQALEDRLAIYDDPEGKEYLMWQDKGKSYKRRFDKFRPSDLNNIVLYNEQPWESEANDKAMEVIDAVYGNAALFNDWRMMIIKVNKMTAWNEEDGKYSRSPGMASRVSV